MLGRRRVPVSLSNDYKEIDPYQVFWNSRPEMAELLKKFDTPRDVAAEITRVVTLEEPNGEDAYVRKMYLEGLLRDFGLNEGNIAQKIATGYGHILRTANKGNTIYAYNPTEGIWVTKSRKGYIQKDADNSTEYDPNVVVFNILKDVESIALKSIQVIIELRKLILRTMIRPSAKEPALLSAWADRDEIIREINRDISNTNLFARNILGKSRAGIIKQWSELVDIDENMFDTNMRWVVCEGGTVDLEKIRYNLEDPIFMSVVPYSPEHMSTQKCHARVDYLSIDYIPPEDLDDLPSTSEFIKGVSKTLPNRGIREFLQARYGVALYGDPGSFGKVMLWSYGSSDTAKSSIQETIAGNDGIFSEYSWTGNATVISQTSGGVGTDTESNRFKGQARGKRFVLFNEMDEGMRLSQSKVKSFTAGDTVFGDVKYGSEANYKFSGTLIMASNDMPRLPAGDVALATRVLVIPFTHHYIVQEKNSTLWMNEPENRANPHWVSDILSSDFERSMILLWTLEGARNYFSRDIGKAIPKEIEEAGDTFKNQSDFMSQIVHTMMGNNKDADGVRQVYRYYTSEQWQALGHKDADGVLLKDFKEAFFNVAGELGITEDWITKNKRKYGDLAAKFIEETYGVKIKLAPMPDGKKRKFITQIRPFYEEEAQVEQAIKQEDAMADWYKQMLNGESK